MSIAKKRLFRQYHNVSELMHTKPKEISRSRLDSWDLGSEFFADDENEGDEEEDGGGEVETRRFYINEKFCKLITKTMKRPNPTRISILPIISSRLTMYCGM